MITYKEHRDKIRSGDVLAWSHRGWKSWRDIKIQLIRIFTRSEYSHTATAWVVADRVFVIEAVEPVARIFPLSKLGDFYHIPMDAPWHASTEEYALNKVGSDYKQLQAIKAYFESLGKDSAAECAALTIAIADKDGIDLGIKAIPAKVVQMALLLGKKLFFITNPK